MSRLDHLQSGKIEKAQNQINENKISSVTFLNELEKLGLVVIPFFDSKMYWQAEQYSKILSSCNIFLNKYSSYCLSNPVLWLDAEGIILDFYCDETLDGNQVKSDLLENFSSMDLEVKKVTFKNRAVCLRCTISFKSTEK